MTQFIVRFQRNTPHGFINGSRSIRAEDGKEACRRVRFQIPGSMGHWAQVHKPGHRTASRIFV